MAAPLPADIAAALRYGPKTQQAIRRSSYLSDALKQMQTEGGKDIHSPAELATKLLATAILQRSNRKAEDATLGALKGDMDTETSSLLGALRGPKPPPVTPPAMEPPPQAAPTMPAPPVEPVQQAPLPTAAPQGVQASPQDRDALIRMLATEAIGEGPDGMAAAGHVALNRLRTGYGGAKSLSDVVYAPHQFEGMSRAGQVRPEQYQQAAQVADAILSGQAPDQTGGAVNFLNPDLQLQLGRQIPQWAQGQGQRIGRHVFYGGQGAPPQQTAQAIPPPPMPPDPNGPPDQAALAGGPGADSFPPSAPALSPMPAGGGTPPAASAPQASAAGGNPRVTPEQIALVERLLMDPQTHQVGVAYAMELQKKAAEPIKYEFSVKDGVPVWGDPQNPGKVVTGAVPDALRKHVLTGPEAARLNQPPGTVVIEAPDGGLTFQRPDAGQMVVSRPGEQYREGVIPGSKDDPYRAQKPDNSYRYAPSGAQEMIPGGPAMIAGETTLRDAYENHIKPYITAREGYQKVVQAAGDPTQAGAIAMVFGYMKTLDPTSTVREGEQASVQNSGTIPETVQNLYNKLLAGKSSLTPEQRAQFANSAKGQFAVYQSTYDAATKRYTDLAKSYHYEPTRVIRQFDPIAPYTPPQPVIPDAALNAYKTWFAQGKINQNAPHGDRANPMIARDAQTLQHLDTSANRGKYVFTPDGKLAVIE